MGCVVGRYEEHKQGDEKDRKSLGTVVSSPQQETTIVTGVCTSQFLLETLRYHYPPAMMCRRRLAATATRAILRSRVVVVTPRHSSDDHHHQHHHLVTATVTTTTTRRRRRRLVVAGRGRGRRRALTTNDDLTRRHYQRDGRLWERLQPILKTMTSPLRSRNLAPLDEFHSRGRQGTLDLCDMAGLGASADENDDDDDRTSVMRILDVGCGLGGTARHVTTAASTRDGGDDDDKKVSVTGVDVTAAYVEVGNELSRRCGILHADDDDRGGVRLIQGSALDLPFADETFDMALAVHVQVSVAVVATRINVITTPNAVKRAHSSYPFDIAI